MSYDYYPETTEDLWSGLPMLDEIQYRGDGLQAVVHGEIEGVTVIFSRVSLVDNRFLSRVIEIYSDEEVALIGDGVWSRGINKLAAETHIRVNPFTSRDRGFDFFLNPQDNDQVS